MPISRPIMAAGVAVGAVGLSVGLGLGFASATGHTARAPAIVAKHAVLASTGRITYHSMMHCEHHMGMPMPRA
jgi:predicted transporter